MQPVIDAVTNACQLISGWRQTTPAAEWSEFDETTYQNLGKALQSLHATRPDGGDSLREALVAAQEALQWVFTCQSYVRIHGTGIQPVPKKDNPQIVKVPLGEVRAILLSFGPKIEPVLAQVDAALAAKDGE